MSAQYLFASSEKVRGVVSLAAENKMVRKVTTKSDDSLAFALQQKDRDHGLHLTVHQ